MVFLFFYFEGFTSIPTAFTANDRNRRIQLYIRPMTVNKEVYSSLNIHPWFCQNDNRKEIFAGNLCQHKMTIPLDLES